MITALERAVRWLMLTEAKRWAWQPAPPRPGIRAGGIRDRALRAIGAPSTRWPSRNLGLPIRTLPTGAEQ